MYGNKLQKIILFCILLALAIFALGLATPQDVAESILYIVVVLASLWSAKRRVVFDALILCTLLTVTGFFLSPESPELWISLVNGAFAITAFWIVGLIGLKRLQAEEEIRTLNADLEQRVAEYTAEHDLLQILMDNIPDTIYFKDASSRFTRINRAQVSVLGVAAAEDAIGKTDFDFFQNAELVQSFYDEEQHIIETGEPLINRIEFNPTPDGKQRWFSATKVPIKNPDGGVIGIVGVSRNITEQKQAEEALHQSEERFRLMAWATTDAVWDWDLQTNQIWWGAGLQKIFHYSSETEQTDYEWWHDHIHPEDKYKVDHSINQALEVGMEFWSKEYRFQRLDGAYADIMDRAYIIRDEAGKATRMVGAMMDITERKQAEEVLHESEETTRLIIDTALDAVITIDQDGQITRWNDQAEAIFGWRRAEAVGQRLSKLIIPPDLRAKHERGLKHYSETGEGPVLGKRIDITAQRRNGNIFPVELTIHVLKANNKVSFAAFVRDITERKQAEETIRYQNEMLSNLYKITLDLLRYREIDQLLNVLVKLSAKFLDAPYAEILLVEGEMLVVKTATQNQPRSIGERVGRDGALLSWQAFDTHEPAALSDYANWPNRQAIYDNFPLHAVADFPILNDERCLGVLSLGRDKPDYEFTLDQIQFGRLFANLTALVLNNAQLREALREQSIRDPLTGMYNRRYMEEALTQQLSRVTRQLHPLGLIMIDIDHFKNFNDTHGHAAGDALLRELGRLLQSHIRGGDVACRYGGEEFLLIMPDASVETAQQRAELLRHEAKALRVQDDGQSLEGITLSLGVAIYPEHGRSIDSVLRAADAALYRAKQEGRDRVAVADRAY